MELQDAIKQFTDYHGVEAELLHYTKLPDWSGCDKEYRICFLEKGASLVTLYLKERGINLVGVIKFTPQHIKDESDFLALEKAWNGAKSLREFLIILGFLQNDSGV